MKTCNLGYFIAGRTSLFAHKSQGFPQQTRRPFSKQVDAGETPRNSLICPRSQVANLPKVAGRKSAEVTGRTTAQGHRSQIQGGRKVAHLHLRSQVANLPRSRGRKSKEVARSQVARSHNCPRSRGRKSKEVARSQVARSHNCPRSRGRKSKEVARS